MALAHASPSVSKAPLSRGYSIRFHSFTASKSSLHPSSFRWVPTSDLWPRHSSATCPTTGQSRGMNASEVVVGLPVCSVSMTLCLLHSRMFSIVLLNKGSLSHWWTVFFVVFFFSGFDCGELGWGEFFLKVFLREIVIWSTLSMPNLQENFKILSESVSIYSISSGMYDHTRNRSRMSVERSSDVVLH